MSAAPDGGALSRVLARVENRADRELERVGSAGRVLADESAQALDVAVGGALERRRQQVLLGLEPVGRRSERQPCHLGDAPVSDGIDPYLRDDLENRIEQRLAAGRSSGSSVAGSAYAP